VLATTVELKELHVDPSRLDPAMTRSLALALAAPLGLEAEHLEQRMAREGRRDVLLARDLTPAQAAAARAAVVAASSEDRSLRGVLWTRDVPRRFYPGREEGASLMGLVGHNGTGLAGLERSLDRQLRGEVFKYVLWRDRKGRRVTPDETDAGAGQTVMLTIDRRIQHIVEQALETTLVQTGAGKAYAVVIDLQTGEILALANRPTQNPNDTRQLDLELFKNHAAVDAFEPGSVFKPFVAAAALEEELVIPESMIDCEGGHWVVGNKTIHDDHPHGRVTVSEVIKYSSNIGAAKLAFLLGGERTLGYLNDFGFARMSGLNLPGETRGAMRSPGDIKPIELATTSYGHGVTANAVQLAAAIGTLGNGGVRMKPHLVKELRDENGDILREIKPEVDRRVVSETVARQVVVMMESVTETGGTGTRARVDGFRVAGKTGTAWKHIDGGYSATARIGSFVGLIPADAPRLAIAVVVDTPTIGSSYGGIVAAPAFAEIGGKALRVLGVEGDPTLVARVPGRPGAESLAARFGSKLGSVESELARNAPTADPELQWQTDGSLRTPDLTGLSLRDALVTLQGAGLTVQTLGSGTVASQTPAAGQPIQAGEQVSVVLQ
jgi:cell division protein FtsI (penicillin-binding protein 3)